MKSTTSVVLDLVAIAALQKAINMQTVNSLIEITKQFDKSARPKIVESLEILLKQAAEQSVKFDELVNRLKSELDEVEES
jgi:hypothetical protein